MWYFKLKLLYEAFLKSFCTLIPGQGMVVHCNQNAVRKKIKLFSGQLAFGDVVCGSTLVLAIRNRLKEIKTMIDKNACIQQWCF